jgi:hypothetical protein
MLISTSLRPDVTKPLNLPLSKCGAGQKKSPRLALGSEFLAEGGEGGGGIVNSNKTKTASSGYGIPFTSMDGTYNSGFFMGPNDKILNQVDLVNYNADTKNIYLNYEIEYVDGHVGSDSAAVLMSVTGCEEKKIKLDKGGVATTASPKFPVTKNGMIVAASEYSRAFLLMLPSANECRILVGHM